MADNPLFKNIAKTTIGAGGIDAVATTLPLSVLTAFPTQAEITAAGTGAHFMIFVTDAATGADKEIMKVTAVDAGASSVTVVRSAEAIGIDAATAYAFIASDIVELRATAGSLTGLVTAVDTYTGDIATNTTNIGLNEGRLTVLEAAADIDKEIFTADGTWTKPASLKSIKVTVIGGGGGAGGVGTGFYGAGQSAGGGGTAIEWITAASLGATVAVDVGGGGSGGASGPNNGSDGMDSTFGSHCTGSGGVKGVADTTAAGYKILNGGVGGAATGGDINIAGGDGGRSFKTFTDGGFSSGMGGGTYLAPNGGSSRITSGDGEDGVNYGSGGSGGVSDDNTPAAGGDGADGIVIVEEFY